MAVGASVLVVKPNAITEADSYNPAPQNAPSLDARHAPLTVPEAPAVSPDTPVIVEPLPEVEALIWCESEGQNVEIIDTNGKWSRGILQFQDETWAAFSRQSGIKGSPLNRNDAIRMANWAVRHGYIGHWSCARTLGLIEKEPEVFLVLPPGSEYNHGDEVYDILVHAYERR